MSFDITFLGALGGPIEASTCCLLVKPHDIDYADVILAPESPLLQVDAGSGCLLLAELIGDPESASRLLQLYADSAKIESYTSLRPCWPFSRLKGSPFRNLKRILQKVPTILVTHPHLDHIVALVLNSAEADFGSAGTTVHASEFTARALQDHIFNGKVWPDMVALRAFCLNTVEPQKPFETNSGLYSITMFPIQHGVVKSGTEKVPYLALAYFIHHTPSDAKLLIFGDFEADRVLGSDLNRQIWQKVARFVADGSLKAIVLECSMPTQKDPVELYGHLMPEHLIGELETLLSFCKSPLAGLNVIVTHVKDTPGGVDPRRLVLEQLRALASENKLEVSFSMALSGLTLTV